VSKPRYIAVHQQTSSPGKEKECSGWSADQPSGGRIVGGVKIPLPVGGIPKPTSELACNVIQASSGRLVPMINIVELAPPIGIAAGVGKALNIYSFK